MIIKLFIAFLVGVFIGIIKLIFDGLCYLWNSYKSLNNTPLETLETIENDQSILDSIEHLKAQKSGYMALYTDLEKQLNHATAKQCISIKRQLLALDQKVFSIDQKINKLLEKLE